MSLTDMLDESFIAFWKQYIQRHFPYNIQFDSQWSISFMASRFRINFNPLGFLLLSEGIIRPSCVLSSVASSPDTSGSNNHWFIVYLSQFINRDESQSVQFWIFVWECEIGFSENLLL